jgi:hypothetical protein
MDDDDVQEQGTLNAEDAAAKSNATTPASANATTTGSDEAAPPRPPRPLSEEQKSQQMLKEAFPTVDDSVIKAVLRASSGRIESAFNALLEMTDPDAAERDRPPPQPPRPVVDPLGPTSTDQSQLEADEIYARQLAEHYENVGAYEARTSNRGHPGGGHARRQQTGLGPQDDPYDREHSFIDDDLPVIKESLRKGFVETQSKVNTWFTNLKKRIDDQFDEEDEREREARASGQFMGRPTRDQTRRSNDYDRYDADPELLSDDFAGMKFRSDGSKFDCASEHGRRTPGLTCFDSARPTPTGLWRQQPEPLQATAALQIPQARRRQEGLVPRHGRGHRRLQRVAQDPAKGRRRPRSRRHGQGKQVAAAVPGRPEPDRGE